MVCSTLLTMKNGEIADLVARVIGLEARALALTIYGPFRDSIVFNAPRLSLLPVRYVNVVIRKLHRAPGRRIVSVIAIYRQLTAR